MFSNHTNIMLYVEDVAKEKAFWQAIGFIILAEENLMGFESFEMKSHESSTAYFTVYDWTFIQQVSPEVVDFKPSILFESDDIEALHSKVGQVTETVSPIRQEPFPNFNFASPSGHYYAVKGI
ncbi:glyoxalase [Vaginisenegalia massiliensis]|uniref:glyoxalase n=1 Tax=Vaginisenegalia massiliensis TaxID=2058294 RepID=UPI000F53C315|nr:glyoxalase [Vaginisenegalia massiliensis]